MGTIVNALFAPGFFSSDPVRLAVITGLVVALVSGALGVFTVLRGQSFAGHALSDLGTLGGSSAALAGVGPLWGFVGVGVVVAAVMELFATRQRRSRDVATGLVLGAALGLSALLLYFDTTMDSTTGVTITILFGSLFTVTGGTVPLLVLLGLGALLVLTVLYRPLLLSSVSADLAAARGIPVRALGLAFLVLLALATALSSMSVGTILSPALLVGPAAAALRLTRRPVAAMVLAGAIGTAATWLGIVLAYDSYQWPPAGKGWPVSFFVVTLVFALYLLADLVARIIAARAQRRSGVDARFAARPSAPVGVS
jgi:zinc/manganese transport system permease protein